MFDRIIEIVLGARQNPLPAIGLALVILLPGMMHYYEGSGDIFGKHSLHAQGIVKDAHPFEEKPGGVFTWMVEIEFVDNTGRKRLTRKSKTHEEMRCYENGTKVSVYYRLDNPRVTYIGAKRYTTQFYLINSVVFGLIFLILHLIGLFPVSSEEDQPSEEEGQEVGLVPLSTNSAEQCR